jgi:hypothetical protein
MIFRSQAKDPKQIMMMGMAFLVPALVWPRFVLVTGNLGPDAIDAVRGVLIGLSIGLNLWAATLGGRLRRGGGR